MLVVNDNRNDDPPTIIVTNNGEIVLQYNWVDDSTLNHAANVIRQRLNEMGETDIAEAIADQVSKL